MLKPQVIKNRKMFCFSMNHYSARYGESKYILPISIYPSYEYETRKIIETYADIKI